jgi:hypothetical protein
MAVWWDVVLILTGVSEELTANITMMMEAVSSSETWYNFYHTVRRNIQEMAISILALRT